MTALDQINLSTKRYIRDKFVAKCVCEDGFEKYVRAERLKVGIEDPPVECTCGFDKLYNNIIEGDPLIKWLKDTLAEISVDSGDET